MQPAQSVRDAGGEQAPELSPEEKRRHQIAEHYASLLNKTGIPGDHEYRLADDIINKNAYGLEWISNGMNPKGKEVFSKWTGVQLPRQNGATWKAIRDWAGVTDGQEAVRVAKHKVDVQIKSLEGRIADLNEAHAWVRDKIEKGYDSLDNLGGKWALRNPSTGEGFDLSKRGTKLSMLRPLIAAEIDLDRATKALGPKKVESPNDGQDAKAEGGQVDTQQKEQTNERNDQPPAESRDAAAASPAESQGTPLPRPAGPWSAEELNERGLVEDANAYMKARDIDGAILTGAISTTIGDREKALGLPLPGVGGREGLPASLAVTYDKAEYGEPEFAEVFRVEFGGEALEIQPVELSADQEIVGVPPLVLRPGDGEALYAFRVDGLPGDVFDFVDAVEQAYALLAERASRSPKGQQIDDQVSTQLEGRDEPTDAQKEAENYQKAHVSVLGLEISVETEKGAQRTGKDKDGGEWSVTMPAHYGYIKGTRGADKDHLDIFLGPKPDNGQFYIVNQNQPDSSKFDEHKVMLGYDSAEAAQADYLLSFSGAFGGRVFGSIAGPFSLDEFKAMLPDLAKPRAVKAKGAEVADVKLADAAPEFTTLKDRDGRTVTVRTTDLNGERDRLPMFTKDGKRKPGVIHRDNLDPTGEKLAGQAEEDAKNPLFDIITTKNGETFAAAGAAEREIYRRGLQATHEAVPAEDVRPGLPGYLIRRIAGNNKDSAPLQVESSDKNASKNNSDQPAAAPQEVESSSAGSLAPAVKSFKHTKTGETIYSVTMPVQVSREDYQAINRAAVRNGGRWSSFKGPGVIPGFHFKNEEKAKAFAADSAVAGVLANYGTEQNEGSKQPVPSEASAAPEAVKVEPDAALIAIFEGMDSGGLAKNRAEKAAAEHPMAENIRAVDDGFHDMLMSLMDAGILEVNGQKTITEDNKKCV